MVKGRTYKIYLNCSSFLCVRFIAVCRMKKTLSFISTYILLMIFSSEILAQEKYSLSGIICEKESGRTVELATVVLKEVNKWGVTDANGKYVITEINAGKYTVVVSCLGYQTYEEEVSINKAGTILNIKLDIQTLGLNEVSVTAQPIEEQSTTYKITSTALEHEQIFGITQIQSLLPGGKTSSLEGLTSTQRLSIRSEVSQEKGNPSFGTALEIDGVRLQNNADFNSFNPNGVDTRNISTVNIESVEVITGIASVEQGDLSNGIVKINTKKGRTPYKAVISINPKTKQYGLSKGFALGNNWGTLNISGEHTLSISEIMSPHKTYERNSLSLLHNKHFKNRLTITSGFTINHGGYNTEDDPDLFTGTYIKKKDNVIRGNIAAKWFLNKKWINNLWFSTSVNYSNKRIEERDDESNAATLAANHATETGYFMATDYDEDPNAPVTLLPTGYWYETKYEDNKQIDFAAKLKADKVNHFRNYTNKILAGIDYSNSGNLGKGTYYSDMRYAPNWRPYVFKDVPHTNNIAVYLEDKITKELNQQSQVTLVAGLRSDNTYINQSEYGWVGNISPRINAKYTYKNNDKTAMVRSFNMYAGWGKSVKLPSLGVLYPKPSYGQKYAFASTSATDNTAYYAVYNQSSTTLYNPELKYQYNKQIEVGFGANVRGTKINISVFRSKIVNPYIYESVYTPYSYKKTDQASIENSAIPVNDRRFSIDETTGIVTMHDVTGYHSSYALAYEVKNEFLKRKRYTNGSPATRVGIDWIVDFAKINALSTSFRIDGSYFYYKGFEDHISAYTPNDIVMANGEPYKYIGYYIGTPILSNGIITKQIDANVTIKTHIPKIRMVVTLKVESSLYDYTQRLSEYSGGKRGFILEDVGDFTGSDTDIYNRDKFIGMYPLYYTTWEDMDTKIPFKEKFLWAKDNDPELYTELSRLVEKTGSENYFNKNKISAYYSANINVTKEIGDIASVSFFARNFTHNLGKVSKSRTHSETSLYKSYLPSYYYGITMRLTF